MTLKNNRLKECYDSFGGDYETVKQRIHRDESIERFMIKFLQEPSFNDLSDALENEKYEEAFRAVHSLKGLSANLGFKRLEQSSAIMTELLRKSDLKVIDKGQCRKLFESVSADYKAVVEAIKELEKQ